MFRRFSYFILQIFGWRVVGDVPPEAQRCVLVFAPHTSAWDFIVGKMALYYMRVPVKFMIKKEAFWFPLGLILKAMGAIPVNRQQSMRLPVYAAELFEKNEKLALMIAPEGTRKNTENWKRGFHYIAQKANVPMAIGFMDWKTKTGGIITIKEPSNDYEKDLQEIQKLYYGMQGKYKGQFNLENRTKDE